MNLAVGEKNRIDNFMGKKRLLCPFRRQEFWKCIGFNLLTVTYGNKGKNNWRETKTYVGKKARTNLHRDVSDETDLRKVRCDIYRPRYCYDFH